MNGECTCITTLNGNSLVSAVSQTGSNYIVHSENLCFVTRSLNLAVPEAGTLLVFHLLLFEECLKPSFLSPRFLLEVEKFIKWTFCLTGKRNRAALRHGANQVFPIWWQGKVPFIPPLSLSLSAERGRKHDVCPLCNSSSHSEGHKHLQRRFSKATFENRPRFQV